MELVQKVIDGVSVIDGFEFDPKWLDNDHLPAMVDKDILMGMVEVFRPDVSIFSGEYDTGNLIYSAWFEFTKQGLVSTMVNTTITKPNSATHVVKVRKIVTNHTTGQCEVSEDGNVMEKFTLVTNVGGSNHAEVLFR